jgi:heptosyltransferase-2
MVRAPNLLVRAPNWTGDLVMATPGFRALRGGFPDARITLHVRESLIPLLAGAPWFDEVLPLTSHHRGPAALLREAAALRERRFDLGLCLPDSFSSALLMRLGGVARIVGYRGQGRGWLLDDSSPTPPAPKNGRRMLARELHVLGLVEALGCPRQGTELELFVTEAEEVEAGAALAACGVRGGDEVVALAPGASYGASKLWPAESFARVGDALTGMGARVVILGTPEERALAARVTRAMAAPAANLTGAIGVGPLKAVLRRSRLLVCNDAGARHVAVAFGVPCVVLMGPTSLEKTNLNLERVAVLSAEGVSCRPCYLRDCPIDHRCMTGIDPDRAIAAAQRALSLAAAGPAA